MVRVSKRSVTKTGNKARRTFSTVQVTPRSVSFRGFRGQVDAPIELVVAIIVLVMSMALAFYVINEAATGRCLADLKTQTQHLQESMLDVALGSTGSKKTVTFTMPRCGDRNVEALEFVQFKAAEFCRLCPGHFGGCWQIIPVAKTKDGLVQVTESITCVELPAENVRITQEQRCERLSDTACPPGVGGCEDQLGITKGVRDKAIFRTLGSSSSKTFTITFTKATVGVDIAGTGSEASEIRICAQSGRVNR